MQDRYPWEEDGTDDPDATQPLPRLKYEPGDPTFDPYLDETTTRIMRPYYWIWWKISANVFKAFLLLIGIELGFGLFGFYVVVTEWSAQSFKVGLAIEVLAGLLVITTIAVFYFYKITILDKSWRRD